MRRWRAGPAPCPPMGAGSHGRCSSAPRAAFPSASAPASRPCPPRTRWRSAPASCAPIPPPSPRSPCGKRPAGTGHEPGASAGARGGVALARGCRGGRSGGAGAVVGPGRYRHRALARLGAARDGAGAGAGRGAARTFPHRRGRPGRGGGGRGAHRLSRPAHGRRGGPVGDDRAHARRERPAPLASVAARPARSRNPARRRRRGCAIRCLRGAARAAQRAGGGGHAPRGPRPAPAVGARRAGESATAAALTPAPNAANSDLRTEAHHAGGPRMSIPQSGGGPIERHEQLAEYLAAGCKPPENWRIGTEHEKFGYCKDTLLPIPYEGERSVLAVLEGLRDGLGATPVWTHEQMPMMPKGRYKLMDSYMQKVGTMGRTMMRRTCTVQVNLDFGSEADMVQKFRVALALQPVATALFANSPFLEGRPNGHKSWRARVWRDLDPDRTGMLPFVFDEGFGFEQYADYALDVPMYFVYRDGRYIDALGQSFRDFLRGELPALPGEKPTLSDWADHLTTIFPEARIKKFMEMRGADGGPWRRLCALPAFWVGLMYNQSALDAAWDLVKHLDAETREGLRVAASVHALQGEAGGVKLHDLAREAVAIAEAGLRARAMPGAGGMIPDETHFLNALSESVESGMVPADELLARYHGAWNGDLSRIFAEYSY